MKVILIRHGKTEANERHLYCGGTDIPLSSEGRAELKAGCYGVPCARFATSGMKRTEETLALLFGEKPHIVLDGFREVDFGEFEMHSYEELKGSAAYQEWITGDNEKKVPPGGESGEAMAARVAAAWKTLEQTDEDWVLVTHGGVIAAIMEMCFPEKGKNRYQWQPKPGGGYWLIRENGRWQYGHLVPGTPEGEIRQASQT